MNYATIGLICTVIGAILSILSIFNLMKKNIKEDATCDTEMKSMLQYIGKDVKDIKYDIRTHETRMGIIEERVTRVEESAKSAHKRLDGIEKGE